MQTSSSNQKIRQIINLIKNGLLIPRPEFQRKLVWTSADKLRFIETILKGYPFPEIYFANGDIDTETGEGTQLLVDGQQRVTTIYEYFTGSNQFKGNLVPTYQELEEEDKKNFLNYDVSVRDLGNVDKNTIIDVFHRMNSTNYPLNEVEINNAIYAGEFMQFASYIAENDFFFEHKVFRPSDIKRMGDTKFVLQLITTIMEGYFNRDELIEKNLSNFNENFPHKHDLNKDLHFIFSYIDECGFDKKSRIWKKSDLFTAIVELHYAYKIGYIPEPSDTLNILDNFYEKVDSNKIAENDSVIKIYSKASIQASNDRINRVRRGCIISALLQNKDPEDLLKANGLI